MAKRPNSAVVDYKIRLKEPIRKKIEIAAKDRGVSMNAEIVTRIENSFSIDDSFGGPELRNVATLMAAAFNHAGQMSADRRSPREWMKDNTIYTEAVVGVLKALLISMPDATEENVATLFKVLSGRLATFFHNATDTKR